MAPSIQKAAALPARQAHQIMAWHSCSLCGQYQSLWKACHGLLKLAVPAMSHALPRLPTALAAKQLHRGVV